MRSFSSLMISTVCSILLIIWNVYSFYNGFTTGRTYYWINGIAAFIFLLFFILNMRDFKKKNYRTS
ncbi:hypothetical protein ACQ3VH_12625 [Bacillus pretiosus]|uniref:hypothetical protein n=1 Tax=Bacillus TaxID=1386 RepID=UPI000855B358|nr:hypothetical protein [Bacillus wiedmannii]AZJ23995.1 hypothetical protein CT694_31165 [Bacillus wiedmannii bv. thuringiensis]MCU5331631.1 hypothetical protein [Bacillus wiedmannii]PEL93772.1 hypothetical protein CN626_04905 [Bacillus wiedmannii]QWH69572.1 hypothetical protein EXW41_27990 [Bacillus wiedmannii]SCL90362.1 Uncharacterized protein BCRIVMBC120_01774 [Bacillus wiedmannii]